MSAVNIILVILIFIFLGLLAIRLSLFLARRAICTVISTFRRHNAVQFENALPLESMGLRAKPALISFHFIRDYRPWAFQTLMKAGVIRMAVEGWYYLSEDTLRATKGFECR